MATERRSPVGKPCRAGDRIRVGDRCGRGVCHDVLGGGYAADKEEQRIPGRCFALETGTIGPRPDRGSRRWRDWNSRQRIARLPRRPGRSHYRRNCTGRPPVSDRRPTNSRLARTSEQTGREGVAPHGAQLAGPRRLATGEPQGSRGPSESVLALNLAPRGQLPVDELRPYVEREAVGV